jgi:hypothetical protein
VTEKSVGRTLFDRTPFDRKAIAATSFNRIPLNRKSILPKVVIWPKIIFTKRPLDQKYLDNGHLTEN